MGSKAPCTNKVIAKRDSVDDGVNEDSLEVDWPLNKMDIKIRIVINQKKDCPI